MKIVLSRKGFDNQYGGQPSPILPDGTLLSLPIPSKNENIKFSDIMQNGKTYLEIIKELNSNSKIKEEYTCHLDPDIRKASLPRNHDWKPLFGQAASALGHLENNGITKGDIFLFFGSFRQTEENNGKLNYVKNAHEIHAIYGYLQVGEKYQKVFPKSLQYHPHAKKSFLSSQIMPFMKLPKI